MAQGFLKKAVTSTFSQLESKKNAIKDYCREKHISLKVEQQKITSEFLIELFNKKEAHSIMGFNHSGHIVFQGTSVSKETFQDAGIDQLLIVTEIKESSSRFIQLLQVKLPELSLIQAEDNTQGHHKRNKGFLPLSLRKASMHDSDATMDEQSELEGLYEAYGYEEESTLKESLFV